MNGAERARRRLAREVVKQPFQNPMRIRAGYLSKEARKIVGGGFVGGVGDCAHDCERTLYSWQTWATAALSMSMAAMVGKRRSRSTSSARCAKNLSSLAMSPSMALDD